MKIEVLYFAWLRERIGIPHETVETDAVTVRDLIDELRLRDDWHAIAFADISAIRCDVDQQLTGMDTVLGSAREVAFFPPMTGG